MPSEDREHRPGEAQGVPPMAEVEKLIDDLLADNRAARTMFFSHRIEDLRRSLDAAARENVFEIVDRVFQMIAATAAEMALRSLICPRMATEHTDRSGGAAPRFPPVKDEAERLQRIATFLMGCSTKYTKVRHVSSLVGRQGDPKIVDFHSARVKAEKARDTGKPEKKPEAADA